MSIVTAPNARRSRPLDLVEPNWSSSLLVGIQRLILFDSPRPQDLIRGTQLTLVGSNVTHAATPLGAGIANTNENSYWTIPSFASDVTTRMSMLWVGLHSGGSGPITIRDNSSGGGTLFFFRNANKWDMRVAGTEYTEAGSFLTGVAYAAVATSSLSGAKTFVDGALVINGAAAASAGVTSPWYINQNGPNGTGPLATTVMLAIWDRVLTDQEAVDLSLNPWQLFADRVVVVQKTSVSGAFKAAWARVRGNYVGTGVK